MPPPHLTSAKRVSMRVDTVEAASAASVVKVWLLAGKKFKRSSEGTEVVKVVSWSNYDTPPVVEV